MIILGFVCLIMPGLAWWAWLGNRKEDPCVSLAKILGIGLALIILFANIGFILGIRFSLTLITILMLLTTLLVISGFIKKGLWKQPRYWLHLGVGILILGLTIVWRLYQARGLFLPNWVDSQHHFLIINKIIENGGVPEDLLPYLPMPFYYHFGYHAVAALFTAISGLPTAQAMLILGQVLNALIGLSVYALGKALWRNWQPALATALLISFATRMPAYYLSWGRYTLTVGLIFLPLSMGLAQELTYEKNNWGKALSLGLLTTSLLLTHYFAALLLVIYLCLLSILLLLRRNHSFPQTVLQISWIINSAVVGLLLALPWLWRVAKFYGSTAKINTNLPKDLGAAFAGERWRYIWQLLGPLSNHVLFAVAGVGLILILIRKQNRGVALWSLVLLLLSLPFGVTLGPFRADHFAIVLFLPITLLSAWLFWQTARWVGHLLKQAWVTNLLLLLLVLGWIAWGVPSIREVVNPTTVLVTAADLDALEWIAENTPPEARFYINTAYWLSNAYRCVDGGGWILPYTGRWALVPTIFYGFSPDTAWVRQISGWGKVASGITGCSADFWELAESAQLDWIYLRTGIGSLQPSGLSGCHGIEQAYSNEMVTLYRIIQD